MEEVWPDDELRGGSIMGVSWHHGSIMVSWECHGNMGVSWYHGRVIVSWEYHGIMGVS